MNKFGHFRNLFSSGKYYNFVGPSLSYEINIFWDFNGYLEVGISNYIPTNF